MSRKNRLIESLDRPHGLEREIVLDERDRTDELNGEDSRTLGPSGRFAAYVKKLGSSC